MKSFFVTDSSKVYSPLKTLLHPGKDLLPPCFVFILCYALGGKKKRITELLLWSRERNHHCSEHEPAHAQICTKVKATVASAGLSGASRTRALTVPLLWALLRPNLESLGHLRDPHDKKDIEGLGCVHKREQSS